MGATVVSLGAVSICRNDFRGDPDLVLPLGGAWGELGNFLFSSFKIFMNFKYRDIYICIRVLIL